jgi:hypothetical protein
MEHDFSGFLTSLKCKAGVRMCSKWSTKIQLAGSTADRVCGSIFRGYYVRPDSVWNFEVPESIFVGAPSTSTDGWFFTFHRHPKCGISEPKCAMWRVNLNHFMILLWQLFRLDHWRLTHIAHFGSLMPHLGCLWKVKNQPSVEVDGAPTNIDSGTSKFHTESGLT